MAEPHAAAVGTTLILKKVGEKGVDWVLEHPDEVKGLFKKFRRTIWKRKPGILILGAGGVGKTTLAKILTGKFDFLIDSALPYEQSVGIESFSHKGSEIELIVGPGQETRRAGTWEAFLGLLRSGKARGVVFICAYGYHSLQLEPTSHRIYKTVGSLEEFLEAYYEVCRAEELVALTEVAQALAQNPKPTWLLTYVAKQDLWADRDAEVRDHYSGQTFQSEIQGVFAKQGKTRFRHDLLFGSLLIRNFVTPNGTILKRNVEGYDHAAQARSLRELIGAVRALEKWKAK